MMQKRWMSLLLAVMLFVTPALAQQGTAPRSTEGMWLPLKIKELNAEDMRAMGLELSVDEVYNEDAPSVEDGIVRLNGGMCTAEMISPKGLMLTNHHCAYDAIASLSSEDNDLLTDGFWAGSEAEELPVEGATAAFLIRSEDVTEQVLAEGDLNPFQVEEVLERLAAEAVEGTDYDAVVKPMFHGSEYYLFVYEVYRDVRLVGAPPSDIGKFGYDTDNWVWPRHTGDFSLMRVYAGPDNKPATYSPDNKPYQPRHFFPISLQGVEEEDYAMILGYPGSTERYLTSTAVEMALKHGNLDKINVLGTRTEIMKAAMDQSDAVRIKLASEYASLMNSYKYYIGQTTMLERYNIVGKKAAEEAQFQAWAEGDSTRAEQYGEVLGNLAQLHERSVQTDQYMNYLFYGILGPSAISFSFQELSGLEAALSSDDPDVQAEAIAEAREVMAEHFKNFVYDVDKDVLAAVLLRTYEDLPPALHPDVLTEIVNPAAPMVEEEETGKKKKKKKKKKSAPVEAVVEMLSPAERIQAWVDQAYATSYASSEARLSELLNNPSPDALANDPLLQFVQGILGHFRSRVATSYYTFGFQVDMLRKVYLQGLREMHSDKHFYPDANSTMRVTYGKVRSYEPNDGVIYEHYTTIEGIMEKMDPDNPDYRVPGRLVELYEDKDYGRYAKDGEALRVCFLTTNDITGGNSGSPVLNARGELIGCAFDGNWEAMAGDIYVFPSLNRTICVDARYILFVIDKFAGASHLLDEMTIIE